MATGREEDARRHYARCDVSMVLSCFEKSKKVRVSTRRSAVQVWCEARFFIRCGCFGESETSEVEILLRCAFFGVRLVFEVHRC